MEKLDLNLIHQKIDQMSLDTWKVYQNKAKETEQNTKKSETDSLSFNSERDSRLNSRLNEVKNEINFNTTASTGLGKIREELESMRATAIKARDGKLTAEETANLKAATEKNLSDINKTVADTKSGDTAILSKFDSSSLDLSGIDLTSKDALAKLDKALSTVSDSEEKYESRLEKNNEVLNSINEKKELYNKADELVQTIKGQMYSDPLAAIITQSNGLNGNSIYGVLNAL